MVDQTYQFLIENILHNGHTLTTRNSVVKRIFARTLTFTSTPLISVRKTAWKNALREWEWFMSGSTNIKDLHDAVKPWWKPWANVWGDVHFNYSAQFRAAYECEGTDFDQIQYLIDGIKEHPFSRRNVITTWNTMDMASKDCPITNCHGTIIQAFVNPNNSLHLVTYQRSVDTICGLPHNLIQYWAFLLWLAHLTSRTVGSLTWIGGDVHVYEAHFPLAHKILAVTPKASPELVYKPTSEQFLAEDFTLFSPYFPVLTDRAEMIV